MYSFWYAFCVSTNHVIIVVFYLYVDFFYPLFLYRIYYASKNEMENLAKVVSMVALKGNFSCRLLCVLNYVSAQYMN